MTDLIKRARELADAAVAAPWTIEVDASFGAAAEPARIVSQRSRDERRQSGSSARSMYLATVYDLGDAAFIAAAREIVPALCDEVEQLRRDHAFEAQRSNHYKALHTAAFADLAALSDERDAYRAMLADLVASRNRYDDDEIMVDTFRRARELLKHGPGGKERG